ncbi:MAG: patatin-like phospholipase family protein [Clostridiales bacterium]|nr:patatin-like phospholipase family protein [Clostridiales bacterium]
MKLLDDSDVQALSKVLKKNAAAEKYLVSDIVLQQNGRTLQFVDLVMEGGGTLVVALAGYIYALEQANIRFLSIGGSSAGAIVALLLSCLDRRAEEKGAVLAEIISGMDMGAFIDGNIFSNALSRLIGSRKAAGKRLQFALLAILASGTFIKKLGLNPGEKFLDWLKSYLAEAGIHTMEDANKIIAHMPEGLSHRNCRPGFSKPGASLKLVVADLTTSAKVIFPEMAPLYWKDPDSLNPAYMARASMSIPGFFQPMEVRGVSEIIGISEKWKDLCSFDGKIPDKITFSDGGLLSNFPISLFHEKGVPDAPTFGARLGSYSRVVSEISTVESYTEKMLHALRHYSDFEFIYKNPDYSRLIAYIPTAGYNWLNFHMHEEEKLDLFKKGMVSAYEFLERFDWLTYKEIRRKQCEADISLYRLTNAGPAVAETLNHPLQKQ